MSLSGNCWRAARRLEWEWLAWSNKRKVPPPVARLCIATELQFLELLTVLIPAKDAWNWEENFKYADEVLLIVWIILSRSARWMIGFKENKEGKPIFKLNRLVQFKGRLLKALKNVSANYLKFTVQVTHLLQSLVVSYWRHLLLNHSPHSNSTASEKFIAHSSACTNFNIHKLSCVYNIEIGISYIHIYSTYLNSTQRIVEAKTWFDQMFSFKLSNTNPIQIFSC